MVECTLGGVLSAEWSRMVENEDIIMMTKFPNFDVQIPLSDRPAGCITDGSSLSSKMTPGLRRVCSFSLTYTFPGIEDVGGGGGTKLVVKSVQS